MKHAVVTGGAQGIGKAITARLLRDGYAVCFTDIDAEAGREALEEFGAIGTARFVAADVSSAEDVARVFAEVPRLDALVNNAGITVVKPFAELTLEEWRRVIDTNLTSVFLCTKAALPALREARGSIVNIASTRALQSEANLDAYAASKGGIVALTHSLAVSLGPDVRVNCVSPGWIDVSGWKKASARQPAVLRPQDHAQHPAGRVGRPEDVASIVAYLLGDEAGFITGANFVVDGGLTRKMIYEE